MEIKKDTIIRNKFCKGFERTIPVTHFVIHGTGGGGTLNWVRNADPASKRGRRYINGDGLFHYLIERDGTIYEIIDPELWVYHASIRSRDKGTIGVELLNPSSTNKTPYTKEQYKALVWLYGYVQRTYHREVKTAISHNMMKRKYRRDGKACPGKGFDWELFKSMMLEDWNFVYKKQILSNLEES